MKSTAVKTGFRVKESNERYGTMMMMAVMEASVVYICCLPIRKPKAGSNPEEAVSAVHTVALRTFRANTSCTEIMESLTKKFFVHSAGSGFVKEKQNFGTTCLNEAKHGSAKNLSVGFSIISVQDLYLQHEYPADHDHLKCLSGPHKPQSHATTDSEHSVHRGDILTPF